MKIFLICLLEDLLTAISFVLGAMFMKALPGEIGGWWLVAVFMTALIFNYLTELFFWNMAKVDRKNHRIELRKED